MIYTLARLIVESVLEEDGANEAIQQGLSQHILKIYNQSLKLPKGFRLTPGRGDGYAEIKFPDGTDQKIQQDLIKQIQGVHHTVSQELQAKKFRLKPSNNRNSTFLVSPDSGVTLQQVYNSATTRGPGQNGYEMSIPLFRMYIDHEFKKQQIAQQVQSQSGHEYAQASGQSQNDQKKTSSSLGGMRRPGTLAQCKLWEGVV
jgi:hypothetical protein